MLMIHTVPFLRTVARFPMPGFLISQATSESPRKVGHALSTIPLNVPARRPGRSVHRQAILRAFVCSTARGISKRVQASCTAFIWGTGGLHFEKV